MPDIPAIVPLDPPSDNSNLRVEFEAVRKEMLEGRVQRAEKYADYMRNWLALLTAVTTLVLFTSGVLAYRSFGEAQSARNLAESNRLKMEEGAKEVDANKRLVSSKVDEVTKLNENFKSQISEITNESRQAKADAASAKQSSVIARNKAVETEDEGKRRLAALDSKITEQENKLTKRVETLSAEGAKTAFDTKTLGISLASVTDAPYIMALLQKTNGVDFTISGKNFGDKPGTIAVTVDSATSALISLMQIPLDDKSIKSWGDGIVEIALTDGDRAKLRDRENSVPGIKSISFMLSTSSGKIAFTSSSVNPLTLFTQ